MKIEFYEAPILPLGFIRFFRENMGRPDHTNPFTFEELCLENCLIPLEATKEFENELQMKNWLMDKSYTKIFGNDEYECFTKNLLQIKINVEKQVTIYVFFKKKENE